MRRAHQRRLHDRPSLEGHASGRPGGILEARPEPDVGVRRVLILDAAESLERRAGSEDGRARAGAGARAAPVQLSLRECARRPRVDAIRASAARDARCCQDDAADDEGAAEASQGVTVSSSTIAPIATARRDRVGVGDRTRRPEAPRARRSRGCTRAKRREDAEVEEERGFAGGRVDDGVDRRAASERDEPDDADEARSRPSAQEGRGGREERLQDHVVEREGERRADDDERALGALEREIVSGAERDDDRRRRRTRSRARRRARSRMRSRPEDRKARIIVIARRERDDERGDARRRVLLPDVQEQVVADDD